MVGKTAKLLSRQGNDIKRKPRGNLASGGQTKSESGHLTLDFAACTDHANYSKNIPMYIITGIFYERKSNIMRHYFSIWKVPNIFLDHCKLWFHQQESYRLDNK